MDLDELLNRSVPPTTPRTAMLQHELDRMVANIEGTVRPRRKVLRVALASAISAGLFSVGTAGAIAVGIVPTPSWVPWATGTGSSCEMEFTASAAGPNEERFSRPFTQAEEERAVIEANRFLADFDYSSINEADAIREWKKAEDAAIAAQGDPNERQPRLTGDELALTAVWHKVGEQLRADLNDHNIPTEAIAFSQGWRCTK